MELDFQKDVLHLTIRYRTTEIESIKGKKRDEWCEANLHLQEKIKEPAPPDLTVISATLNKKLQEASQLFDPKSSQNNLLERLDQFDTLLGDVLALKPKNWPNSEPRKPDEKDPKAEEKYRQEVARHEKFKTLKRFHQDLKDKSNTLRTKTEEMTKSQVDPKLNIRFIEKAHQRSDPVFEKSLEHTLEFRPNPRPKH